ncbi:MAG: hypothetical protein ACFFAT_20535 [Promethearchaeota archaeon]
MDNELGLEIINSLKYNKDIALYSAGPIQIEVDFPLHKKHFIVSKKLDKQGFNKLNSIIEQNKIEYIYPSDEIININLAKHSTKVFSKIISSPSTSLSIATSKERTYEVLRDEIPIRNFSKNENSKKIYDIGCISDRVRGLLFCAGIEDFSSQTETVIESESIYKDIFDNYAKKILKLIDLYGAWSFKLEENLSGDFKLISITPWMNLKMKIYRYLGVNFPLLSVYECNRDNFQILRNEYDIKIIQTQKTKHQIILPYNTVYIDLDDTIIIKNALNIQIFNFLNQCISNNKKIVLITKHQKNILKTLKKFNVAPSIFNRIIHLEENDEKSQYIVDRNSIFIDDSYHERKIVKEVNKIPVLLLV